jgi:hypothetical protein
MGGSLNIDKSTGQALEQEYTLTASGWVAFESTQQLRYQFFYEDQSSRQWEPLGGVSAKTTITTTLPETDMLQLQVADEIGGISTTWKQVQIRLPLKGVDPSIVQTKIDNIVSDIKNSTQPLTGLKKLS